MKHEEDPWRGVPIQPGLHFALKPVMLQRQLCFRRYCCQPEQCNRSVRVGGNKSGGLSPARCLGDTECTWTNGRLSPARKNTSCAGRSRQLGNMHGISHEAEQMLAVGKGKQHTRTMLAQEKRRRGRRWAAVGIPPHKLNGVTHAAIRFVLMVAVRRLVRHLSCET